MRIDISQPAMSSSKRASVFRFSFCVVLFALCAAAQAQQTKTVYRVGFLSPLESPQFFQAFRQGMRELGYVEGQNVRIEYRSAKGTRERFASLATELVRLNVDVIVASSGGAALAAKKATHTIPIVMGQTGDPVAEGLVASLARPGGNVTGLTALATELTGKRLELLKEAVPKATRVGVLSTPASTETDAAMTAMEEAARSLRINLRRVDVHNAADFEKAFSTMMEEHAGALMVLTGPLLTTNREKIIELAERKRLPAMYGISEFIDAGGLMFYGTSLTDMYHRAATYVDKILKGAKPADLPVEQPTKFELVINLKAAKQIGLTIPQRVLLKADRVIR
jgi:putative tryptophan/tyrosine transport system substrate-binding protein